MESRTVLHDARSLREVLAPLGGDPPDVSGVSIDSRTLRHGDLFFALAGEDPRYRGAAGSGRDGHDFVAAAAAAGAAAAVVARPTGAPLPELVVPDPFGALIALARAARARLAPEARVFAITGSSGKTTARGMLSAGLAACGLRVHASEGSLNNHIGVPLSLARTPGDAEAAVFEIGTNSHGEIAPLSELVRPHVSLLLNVLPVHLEGLGDLAGVRREKLCIAAGLAGDGCLVLHETVQPPEDFAARLLRFGRGPDVDVRLDDEGEAVRVHLADGRVLEARFLAEGPHRRSTACGVLAVMEAAGLDPSAALSAVEAEAPPAGRGRVLEQGGVRIIDDAYNANPESVRQALAGALELDAGTHLALLGDMLELGEEAGALHAGLADACAGFDRVFCVGPLMAGLHEALPPDLRGGWWPDCETLDEDAVVAAAPPGSVLLVKGSNRGFWKHGTVGELAARFEGREG